MLSLNPWLFERKGTRYVPQGILNRLYTLNPVEPQSDSNSINLALNKVTKIR